MPLLTTSPRELAVIRTPLDLQNSFRLRQTLLHLELPNFSYILYLMFHLTKFKLPTFDYITDLISNLSIPSHLRLKILLIIIHGLILVWACINAFTYLGCFDSELLCPQSRFYIPFTELGFPIPTTLPIPLAIILITMINVSHLVYADQPFKINFYLTAICAGLFLLSFIFIDTVIRYEDAFLEELRKFGFQ